MIAAPFFRRLDRFASRVAVRFVAVVTGVFAAASALAPDAHAQDRPSPQALAARHDSLVGGRAILDSVRTMRMSGAFLVPEAGIEAPLEILKVRPNRYFFRASIGQLGEIMTGFDGTHAWAIQPGQGAMLLDGDMKDQLAQRADFYADLHDYSRFVSAETQPESTFEGKRVHPVRLVRANGDTLMEYFEVSTGLSVGSRTTVQSPMGRVESLAIVGDYKEFGPLKVATRIEQRSTMVRLVLAITNVEFDTLDDSAVALPESVRLLIKP